MNSTERVTGGFPAGEVGFLPDSEGGGPDP
jgi:hypothetical protein